MKFSDCYYIAALMNSLAEALSSKPLSSSDAFDMDIDEDDGDDLGSYNACLEEIDRYRRMDEWIPSYHNILSTTALSCKRQLIKSGAVPFRPVDFFNIPATAVQNISVLVLFMTLRSWA